MKRLCIIGGGSTRMRAPYDDDKVIIWATFSVGQELPRVDACFEIHDAVYSPDALKALGCKIYMKEKSVEIPLSERFPIEKLIMKFGKRFNGTVAMILAFAYLEGYRDIWLYGMDFSSEAELSRRNMFYWLMGNLTARGCKITIPEGGLLADVCRTYAYEDDGKAYIEHIRKKIDSQVKDDEEKAIKYRERLAYAKGVMETLAQVERRY